MPASRFEVRFDNAVLAGESDGFGLPVVFLHAGVADRRMWAPQMASAAAAGFHVIAYDRRGFGETQSPDEPFSHLADLEAVLDRGRIVECGSHEELMALNGRYAHLFSLQARGYR